MEGRGGRALLHGRCAGHGDGVSGRVSLCFLRSVLRSSMLACPFRKCIPFFLSLRSPLSNLFRAQITADLPSNKWVLTSSSLPLTFLFLQLAISVLCLNALSFLPANHPFVFHPPRWTLAILTSMAPVCIANVTGLVFNIYCLKLVDASYFQVARGLTLPMTVVLQSLSTGEKPTMGTIASCGLVTWGFTYSFLPIPVTFLDTTVPELVIEEVGRSVEAPMLGMIFGVASAAMIAIHAVLVKVAIKKVEGKTMDLAYWQNALSAIALVPAILISGEVPVFLRTMWGDEGSFSAFAIGSGVTVRPASLWLVARY